MNCCDDYGNCRQGRDCPVRVRQEWKSMNNKLTYAVWFLIAIVGCTLIGAISYLILGLL